MIKKPGLSIIPSISTHARYRVGRTAIVCGDAQATWAELSSQVNRVANALLAAGLNKGEKVCFLCLNSIEAVAVLFGIMRAGGVAVPLSALLTPDLVASLIRDSDSRFIFVDQYLQPLATPALATLDNFPADRRISIGFEEKQWTTLEAFVQNAPATSPAVDLEDSDEANIIYSSGTTGVPKGIIHSHQARSIFAYALAVEFKINNTARTLITTPLFSNATWTTLLPTTAVGGTMIMMTMFDPEAFLAVVEKLRCTHTVMVPTQFQAIVDHPDFEKYDLSSLRVVVCAGATLPLPLKKRILAKLGNILVELYGLTEGPGTSLQPEDMERKASSVGMPISGTEIRIIDDNGREVDAGEVGEIVGIGAGCMEGYHKRPDANREVTWESGDGRAFIRTGDMGRFDEDGFLYILDRKKDMIVSGGFNVFASDIEAVFLQHPQVQDIAVIAVPDEVWGETPLAMAIMKEGADIKPESLKDWANARLAKFQKVKMLEFRKDDFPRNTLGKVLKKQLREPYWSENK